MNAWIFIIGSSLCSIIVAHLLKRSEFRGFSMIRVLSVNYVTAAAVAFLQWGRGAWLDFFSISFPLAGLILLAGTVFIVNFLIFSKSADANGLGVSVAAMRLSLLLPILLSVYWYQEYLTLRQWSGVILVFLALWLLLPKRTGGDHSVRHLYSGLLLLLFLMTGIGDATLKVFESEFSDRISIEHFLGAVFSVAAVIGILLMTLRREWGFKPGEMVAGIGIGLPNLFSAFFLIEALSLMSGGVVYSMVNLFTVFGATLVGLFVWQDRLSRAQCVGILIALMAIFLIL